MNEHTLYTAIMALINLIEYVLLNIFLSHYFEKRKKRIALPLFGILFVCAFTYINMQQIIIRNIITGFILELGTVLVVYKGRIPKKFAFAAIFATMSAIAEEILTFIIAVITAISFVATVESFTTYIVSGLGGKLILLLIIFYLVKKYPQYYELDRGRDILMLSLFPVTAFVSTNVILEFDRQLETPFHLHIITIGLLIAFLFLSVTIFFIYHSALHKKHLENELLLNEEIKLTSEKVFHQQIEAVNKISAIQHEYKRHLDGIVRCIGENRFNELDEYVKRAVSDAESYLIPIPIDFDNFSLNSLYGRFMQQCAECEIELVSDVRFRKFGFLSEFDASIIFGNLFDNALEACADVSEGKRRISFTVIMYNNFAVITLTNTNERQIISKPEGDALMSARRNYKSEGYGIKNIRSTLARYNGHLSYTYTDNEFTSIARIDMAPELTMG